MTLPRVLAVTAAAALAGCAAPSARVLPEAHDDAVLRTARAVLDSGSCPGATVEIADAPVRLEDPRHRGALWQPVRVEGCGRRSRLNMLVAPAPGGAASVMPLLPGTTAADPLLQREGLRLALMAAKDRAPDCDRVAVNDTRAADAAATGTAPGGGAARPWDEIWTLSACGRAFAVPVRFAPGRDGTEITVDPSAVRPLPA
jgi:hypothetical protein